ncbi:MAG: 5'-nucleotidase C-terminal domain-containing protein [Deltaproteobacteria bacterium]|nr:5'-nucleotidase C-terminal domain-containing protein [Deltaproteobacteria bacterium]
MLATLVVLNALAAPVEVVYHADLEGQMAVPRCGEAAAGAEEPDYAAQVAAIRRARDANPAVIALLGGDQLGPDLFTRNILQRDGEAGARDVAALFARAGYDAITLGNHELSYEKDQLERFASTFAATKIPIVVSNLSCEGPRAELCKHVVKDVMLDRGGDKIGVLAVMSPKALSAIAADRRAGLKLEELGAAIPAGVTRLRAAGATLVVAMVQVNSGRSGVEEVMALQRALPRDKAPDVLLSSGMADSDGQRPTVLIRQHRSPPLVGSPSGTHGITRVTIAPGAEGEPVQVDAGIERARADARDEDAGAVLAKHVASYCERYNVPLGKTAGPTTKAALLAYALNVMQKRTQAEVAFVNDGFVFTRAFPMSGRLTRAKLKRAMPHAAVLGTLSVPGATIADLLAAGEAWGRIAFGGAARPAPGKPFEINGRPIDKARSYRIATIDFIAQGGDGAFKPEQLKAWKPLADNPDLRDLVEAALAAGTTFDTPASKKLLTSAISDFLVDLTNTRIANDASLSDAQLSRAQQQAIKIELNGLLQLDHPLHRWDTRLNIKFGYARTQPPGMEAKAQETLDLTQLTSLYTYKGLYRRKPPPPVVPSPYSRVFLETELTVPETRTYRHAEITHTAGALLTVKTRLKLRFGAGYRTELLADRDAMDPVEAQAGSFRPVIEGGATVDPFAIATFRRLSVTAEGSLDYFLLDAFGKTEHQARASGRLSLPLLPLLFVTAGFDMFFVDRFTAGRGASFDATLGLKLHLDATHQSL